jgi:mannose-6-phosphate isomerase-like protein (cupin superfamily)
MRTEVLGGSSTDSDVPTGGVWFAKGSYSHRITNVGTTTLRFIDAEILGAPSSPPDAAALENVPGHERVIDNERVRVYRVVLKPGESTGMHTHGRPFLRVAVSGGTFAARPTAGAADRRELKAGEFEWVGEPAAQSIENVGASRLEVVEIEWKAPKEARQNKPASPESAAARQRQTSKPRRAR